MNVHLFSKICTFGLLATITLSGCADVNSESVSKYQLPLEIGTSIKIWQDHLTHSLGQKRIDMAGIARQAPDPRPGLTPFKVVAARDGTVRFIVDSNSLNCCGGSCDNNYVWIQHTGEEWTKYSHLAKNSVTDSAFAGLSAGDTVKAGQYIGDESNVGRTCGTNNGRHVHFEVLVPSHQPSPVFDNPSTGNIVGENKIPRFCGVEDEFVKKRSFYTVSACPL